MSWRGVAVGAGVVGVLAVAGAGAYAVFGLPWESDEPGTSSSPSPAPPPTAAWTAAPAVLGQPVPAPPAGAPTIADVIGEALDDDDLGGRVGAQVVDLATGEAVYDSGADVPQTPASTLKILTTAAALQVLGADHVFSTQVVATPPGLTGTATPALTLVGAGDPNLTAGDAPGLTRLSDLADSTAAALTDAGVSSVRLGYDDDLFTGPAVDPDWESTYVSGDIVAPTTALTLDAGRVEPGVTARAGDPSSAAAEAFASLLGERGVAVEASVHEAAPADAVPVASVDSAPLASVVERVLDESDNEGAELLARHVALGLGRPGSSAEAGPAVVEALAGVGIDLGEATLLDGSGLARGSEVPAAALAGTLALAGGTEHSSLRAVVSGLPVAGFTGTLDDRFEGDAAAIGLVRAKTGTLTGVSGLAGVTVAANGGTYAFAVLADDVSDTTAARAALDDVVTALAACACS